VEPPENTVRDDEDEEQQVGHGDGDGVPHAGGDREFSEGQEASEGRDDRTSANEDLCDRVVSE